MKRARAATLGHQGRDDAGPEKSMARRSDRERLRALALRIAALPGVNDAPPADEAALIDWLETQVEAIATEAEELRAARDRIHAQMEELFQLVSSYAALDYGRRAQTYEGHDDVVNAMAIGLNMMGEELEGAMVALTEARDKAMEANHAKTRFLANISHELRTPLNAILGYTEIVREDAAAEGRTTMVDDLDKTMLAAHHLLLLIQDILDLSRIEAGRVEIRPEQVRVAQVIDELGLTMLPSVVQAGNTLEVRSKIDRVIEADPLRLQQVLLNLFGNANKFTHQGKIVVDLYEDERDEAGTPRWLAIDVTDTGIGIPEAKLELIFEAFMQADIATTRRYGGSGLGLTISRKLCEMMGGTLTVRSAEGVGSTFTVRLPLAR